MMKTILLAASLGFLAACPDGPDTSPPTWRVLQDELPAALLSVWGPEDGSRGACAVGADAGQGPLWLMEQSDGTWKSLDTSAHPGDLWWVHGGPGGPVYAVGEKARVLRTTPGSGQLTAMDTTALDPVYTLFGVWVAPTGQAFAVGGDSGPTNGPGIVARLVGEAWQPVAELPAEVSKTALFFKVWGRSASDVWVVGEEGTVLHFDGQAWSLETLENKPRLVTVHGDAERLVAVGGANNAVIMERAGGVWSCHSPELVPGLNGVRLLSGRGVAVGNTGVVLFAGPGASWTELNDVPTYEGLHAAWIAPDGRIYAVGGDLMTLTRGVLLSYGP